MAGLQYKFFPTDFFVPPLESSVSTVEKSSQQVVSVKSPAKEGIIGKNNAVTLKTTSSSSSSLAAAAGGAITPVIKRGRGGSAPTRVE